MKKKCVSYEDVNNIISIWVLAALVLFGIYKGLNGLYDLGHDSGYRLGKFEGCEKAKEKVKQLTNKSELATMFIPCEGL